MLYQQTSALKYHSTTLSFKPEMQHVAMWKYQSIE